MHDPMTLPMPRGRDVVATVPLPVTVGTARIVETRHRGARAYLVIAADGTRRVFAHDDGGLALTYATTKADATPRDAPSTFTPRDAAALRRAW